MAICNPLNQVCCGCSVSVGVRFILAVHFLLCGFFIVETAGVVFFPHQNWIFSQSMTAGVLFFAYSLSALPFLALAEYGLETKQEIFLRLYLIFLSATLLAACLASLQIFLLSGPCADLPNLLVMHGRAFACGLARGSAGGVLAAIWGISFYLVFVVWSHCEDLNHGLYPDFKDLAVDEDIKDERRAKMNMVKGVARGFVHGASQMSMDMKHLSQRMQGTYGTEESLEVGLGGSSAIFGGSKHELRYPPPRSAPAPRPLHS
mmetsp:Transcript_67327/g.196849  ORF Transcript_67327/g.196849 Transcript_67327/m.196849 type:complete len:261 (+) Transcript_67327:88-870(+)